MKLDRSANKKHKTHPTLPVDGKSRERCVHSEEGKEAAPTRESIRLPFLMNCRSREKSEPVGFLPSYTHRVMAARHKEGLNC